MRFQISPLRKTVFLLCVRLILAECATLLLFFGTKGILSFGTIGLNLDFNESIAIILAESTLSIAQLIVILLIVLQWSHESYQLIGNEIVYQKGIFRRKERRYSLTNVESIELVQHINGRIFGFGTLIIYSPTLKQELIIRDIPAPEMFTDQIFEVLSPETKSKVYVQRSNRR